MPVSNPSYFPSIRANGSIIGITAGRDALGANDFLAGNNAGANSTVDDLIVIGNNAAAAGIVGATLLGSIVLGPAAAQSVTDVSAIAPNTPGALILIGNGSLSAVQLMDSTIAIGQGIAPALNPPLGFQNVTGNVLIGNGISAGAGIRALSRCVVIGQAAQGMAGIAGTGTDLNVIVGYNAAKNNNSNLTSTVIIGGNAGLSVGNSSGGISSQSVIIGAQADASAYASGAVVIGYQAKCNAAFAGLSNSIGIGLNTQCGSTLDIGGHNIVIGARATIPINTVNGGNVIIGPGAGSSLTAGLGSVFCVENNLVTQAALLYGSFANGNLVLGGSVDGTNRDLEGTNTVKLVNGTIGGASPVGGGYFYVAAGALHWVGSGGTDTLIAPA